MPIVVNCSSNTDPQWRWVEDQLPQARFVHVDWRRRSALERRITAPPLARYTTAWRAARAAREADFLITHLPHMTAWTELFARSRRAPHLAFAFNFTRLPEGRRKAFFSHALQSVDRFLVSSTMERALYADYFGLDAARFDFCHWAGAAPTAGLGPAVFDGDYLCAIGGEGRDYATFLAAMRSLPALRAVLVARPANLAGLAIPPNVQVLTNAPFDTTMNVLRHSRLMALPLLTADTPCGHVTLVIAMFLGKPLVVTGAQGLADYVQDGANALTTPSNDADQLAARIERLWNDRALAERLGKAAQVFAQTNCTERSTVAYLQRWMQR